MNYYCVPSKGNFIKKPNMRVLLLLLFCSVLCAHAQVSSRSDEIYKAESDAAQSIKEKPPATWYKWLLVGFVGGLLLTSPLKKLKNRILTFIK